MENSFQRIMIAVDGSKHAAKAAEQGIELANRLNAEIAFILVVDDSKFIATTREEAFQFPINVMEKMYVEGEIILNDFALKAKLRAKKFLEKGKPSERILHRAGLWKADLIVMGTHGLTGVKHFLMGSVAEQTIRHSTCPVLVVPMK